MTDTGMMAHILGWQLDRIRLDSDICGKLIETFVFNQLSALLDAQTEPHKLFHYRDREKREIDFLIENTAGDLLGIEVKAGSMVDSSTFKHLKWFKNNLTPKQTTFRGIVLYSGEHAARFGVNLWAVPIHHLWS